MIAIGIFIFYTVNSNMASNPDEVSISDMIDLSKDHQISAISIKGDQLDITKVDGSQLVVYKESNATLNDYQQMGLVTEGIDISSENNTGINWGSCC
jgi:ATP-dependent Zn protease